MGERLLYGERACRTNLLQQVAAELAFLWGAGTGDLDSLKSDKRGVLLGGDLSESQ